MNIDTLISGSITRIAELPDRTSPADQPEMMLVTADELGEELRAFALAAEEAKRQDAPDLLAEALTWIEDQEPDGDEDIGQTGWCRTGAFFVPSPTPEHPDTVDYIDTVKVADFVLWARDEIVKLRGELAGGRKP